MRSRGNPRRADALIRVLRHEQREISRRQGVRGIDTVGPSPRDDLLADPEIDRPWPQVDVRLAQRARGVARVEQVVVPDPPVHDQEGERMRLPSPAQPQRSDGEIFPTIERAG